MRLSVITPTFNNGPELRRALTSVFLQPEIKNGKISLELILVNDASAPKYVQKLEAIKIEFGELVKLIHLPENTGPAAARNEGIKKATGDWIGFVDADDQWPNNKLNLLGVFLESKEFSVVGGKVKYFSENNQTIPALPFDDDQNRVHHVHLGALLVRRAIFEEGLLWFNEKLRIGEDTDWWIRIRENKIPICLVEEETLHYFVHEKSITATEGNQNREMLNLIFTSLQRRRNTTKTVQPIPALKSFSADQSGLRMVVFFWRSLLENNSSEKILIPEYCLLQSIAGLREALEHSRKLTKTDYFIYTNNLEKVDVAILLQPFKKDPYLHWAIQEDITGSFHSIIVLGKILVHKSLDNPSCTDLIDLQDFLINQGYTGIKV
jgi:glycosyltransferase involved in cell wall biosynthesis